MAKRHEVQILRRAGHGQREIAARVSISARSVGRIEAEDPVRDLDDAAARTQRRVGRPSKVERFRKWATELLAEEPGLPTLEVLHRARQEGYVGGKSALYAMVAEVRPPPPPPEPIVRFEGWPASSASTTSDRSTCASSTARRIASSSSRRG